MNGSQPVLSGVSIDSESEPVVASDPHSWVSPLMAEPNKDRLSRADSRMTFDRRINSSKFLLQIIHGFHGVPLRGRWVLTYGWLCAN